MLEEIASANENVTKDMLLGVSPSTKSYWYLPGLFFQGLSLSVLNCNVTMVCITNDREQNANHRVESAGACFNGDIMDASRLPGEKQRRSTVFYAGQRL